jgi:hypothetical protein
MTSRLLAALPETGFSSRQQLMGIDLLHRLCPVGVAMLDQGADFYGASPESLVANICAES